MHAVHLLKTGASLEAAEEAARRAITLQPQDALAYVALGALAEAPEGVRLLQVASRCALSPCTLSRCTLSRCKSLAPSSESEPPCTVLAALSFPHSRPMDRAHPAPTRPAGGLSVVAIGRGGHAPAGRADHVPRSRASPRACAA